MSKFINLIFINKKILSDFLHTFFKTDRMQTAPKPTSPSHASISVLSRVNIPADIKGLKDSEIKQLADEVRAHVIESVAQTGGHLGAGLGVVELTTALHAVFDTPKDKLIWDVGHQCYPHKVLTGRKDHMNTIT